MVRVTWKEVQNTKLLWAFCVKSQVIQWKIYLLSIRWYKNLPRSIDCRVETKDWKIDKWFIEK